RGGAGCALHSGHRIAGVPPRRLAADRDAGRGLPRRAARHMSAAARGTLLSNFRFPEDREIFETLAEADACRIERIVSSGQATPAGEWLDQAAREFVVVLSGRARLRFEGEDAPLWLGPGDWVDIAPHARHRVDWTDPDQPTVWLAVHI